MRPRQLVDHLDALGPVGLRLAVAAVLAVGLGVRVIAVFLAVQQESRPWPDGFLLQRGKSERWGETRSAGAATTRTFTGEFAADRPLDSPYPLSETGRECTDVTQVHGLVDEIGDVRSASAVIDSIEAVVFDVGECLVDETREYGTWADWLGVPRHTFAAVFGAVIARGLDYRDAFQVFVPGFDLTQQRQARADAGKPESFGEQDLYPDVRPALEALRESGCWVGIAGNQTVRAGGILRSLDLPTDMIATSDDWGVSKPDPAFFDHVIAAAPCAADRILYVGDRLDNDIRPAAARGLKTALIRRGPWGVIQQHDPDANRVPSLRIDSLAELPDLIGPRSR